MIMVGDRKDSRLYVEAKGRACVEVGIHSQNCFFPNAVTQDQVLQQIQTFNENPNIDGILIQVRFYF